MFQVTLYVHQIQISLRGLCVVQAQTFYVCYPSLVMKPSLFVITSVFSVYSFTYLSVVILCQRWVIHYYAHFTSNIMQVLQVSAPAIYMVQLILIIINNTCYGTCPSFNLQIPVLYFVLTYYTRIKIFYCLDVLVNKCTVINTTLYPSAVTVKTRTNHSFICGASVWFSTLLTSIQIEQPINPLGKKRKN